MPKHLLLSMLAIMLLLAGCGTSTNEDSSNGTDKSGTEKKDAREGTYPQLTAEVAEDERLVEMVTSMGKMKIKLFPKYAPKAVENFIKHSENGYYEGVIFHRVIKDFMIQGGDPDGTGMGGESVYGKPFEDEFSDKLRNFRGALSMANSGENTNGSQFFIVQSKTLDDSLVEQMKELGFTEEIIDVYKEKGGTPWLDDKHTVFGQVIEGMDVVDQIANTEVGEGDRPVEDVVIEKINILK